MNPPGSSLEIYFVRHGETAWSLAGHHTGRTDLPLTVRGEQATRDLRVHLRHLTFDHVFTSPCHRARQTCESSGWAACAQIDPGLAEWDYSDYEGRRSADIHGERPGWDIFTDGCPAGESPEQVTARADGLITRLRALSGRVAIFSHGHSGRAVGVRWIDLPIVQARHFILSTASLSILGQASRPTDPSVITQRSLLSTPTNPTA